MGKGWAWRVLRVRAGSACGNDILVCRVLRGVLRCFISTKALSGSQTTTAFPSLLQMNGSHAVLVRLGKKQAFLSY